MTKRRAQIALVTTLAMILVVFALVFSTTYYQLGDQEQRPTPGCEQYNTESFSLRILPEKREVDADEDAGRRERQAQDRRPDVGAAAFEAACQGNALARAGIRTSGIGIIVTSMALGIAAFALLVPVVMEEFGTGAGQGVAGRWRRSGSALLSIDVDYTSGTPAWLLGNVGSGGARVEGFAVLDCPSGANGAAIAASAALEAREVDLAPGRVARLGWTGVIPPGDVVAVFSHVDGSGGGGLGWARFALCGAPARHQKREEGRILRP